MITKGARLETTNATGPRQEAGTPINSLEYLKRRRVHLADSTARNSALRTFEWRRIRRSLTVATAVSVRRPAYGEGHFYDAHMVKDSQPRWAALAEQVAREGLQ